MEVNVKPIIGSWDLGYSLDKHILKSVHLGDNYFDNTRSESGEAIYQLKYHSDYQQIPIIAAQMYASFSGYFSSANLVVPMPPSKTRPRQPVIEIAQELAKNMGIPCYVDLLVKTRDTQQMKDIVSKKEKVDILVRAFSVNDKLGDGLHDVLIVDDLSHSGSSVEAATTVLRGYDKIRKIFAAVVTRQW